MNVVQTQKGVSTSQMTENQRECRSPLSEVSENVQLTKEQESRLDIFLTNLSTHAKDIVPRYDPALPLRCVQCNGLIAKSRNIIFGIAHYASPDTCMANRNYTGKDTHQNLPSTAKYFTTKSRKTASST
jgi:hypothetical protein